MLLEKKVLIQRENHFFIGKCCFFHWRMRIFGKKERCTMAIEFATCDLCDAHKHDFTGEFRVLPPVFRDFGQVKKFSGPVETVKCFEDNTLVKAAVDSPGMVDTPHGRVAKVLVVDGGGSLRRALLGGNLGAAAARNGWAGVVIDGCVRDTVELADQAVGIRALAPMPLPTEKRNEGLAHVAVQVQGVWVRPGDWLYADEDGIVVASKALL
jgi:regulator of ribonuclease activity A